MPRRMILSEPEIAIITHRRELEAEFNRGVQTVMASILARKDAVLTGKISPEAFIFNLEELYGERK